MIWPRILDSMVPNMFTHLEASANYTVLNLKGGEKLISGYSLNVFEGLFGLKEFVRLDRSNLINLNFIYSVRHKEDCIFVTLKNDMEILIPRRRIILLQKLHPKLFKVC